MGRLAARHGASARASAEHAWTTAQRGDYRAKLARFGLAAKGILYGSIGILALNVAAGAASQSASRRGAIELVASQPFGQWLLGILTAGLLALAIWQVIIAWKGDPVEGSETKDRVKFAGKAIIYFVTAGTALSILIANWSASAAASGGAGGGTSQQQATATILSWPGGAWIVGFLGAAVIAAGVYQLYKHSMHKEFMTRLNRLDMDARVAHGVERAGRAGYAARAIVFGIIGSFLIVAAVQHDPQEAVGLSGALASLPQRTWGQVVLWGVAGGLFLYGVFCFAEAKYRRAT